MSSQGWMKQALEKTGIQAEIVQVKSVSGGEINQAYYVETTKYPLFIKAHDKMDPTFFNSEVDGLTELKEKGNVLTPRVYGVFQTEDEQMSGCVMEWIQGEKTNHYSQQLGEAVAKLHQATSRKFGYRNDTYIGEIHQKNNWWTNWNDYYRSNRLLPQVQLGERLGYMPSKRKQRMEKLMDRLQEWIPANDVKPSLLHGDLWGGNVMVAKGGKPCFIDPSVVYGDHELELAFTELFGGFSEDFYEAYAYTQPVDRGYDDRKELYQLFYLLVHLNIFGEIYGGHVDTVLKRYVG
ncbi:fructosamine kinase family protein [Salipaludibacillus daqingensis]|uniref:fructosamine kinase family protein n=1 Tax=Salipaludibacillus daqingensis TaxID=3041001 RepID=UPI002473360C|nr:fructosamine kinase family protein [Salipaludibacillus daqingensis]